MVVVVPRLAERQRRQPDEVARLVVGVEAPAADEVAQRVDRERHVVQQEDPHQAAPQQRDQRASSVPPMQPAERERHREPEQRPTPQKVPVDERASPDRSCRSRRIALACRAAVVVNIQPTCACHSPASAPRSPGHARQMRAVRVALLVGEGVVLAVVGHPADDRTLNGHRAEHRQHARTAAGARTSGG